MATTVWSSPSPQSSGARQSAPGTPTRSSQDTEADAGTVAHFLLSKGAGTKVIDAWKRVTATKNGGLEAAGGESKERELRDELRELKGAVERLSEKQSGNREPQGTQGKGTWAEVAARGRGPRTQQRVRGSVAPPARREKEVLLAGVSRAGAKAKTAGEVATEIGTEGGVKGVRKLPNGMFALSFADVAAKAAWCNGSKSAALEKLGEGVSVRVHTVDVIVSGFPGGSVSKLDQERRIQAITSENPGVMGLSKATAMRASPYRSTESLILGLESPEAANKVIDEGVKWCGCILSAEPFTRGVRAERCYKCQQYGHTARFCRAATKCGWCAGGHDWKDCPVKGKTEAKACAACRGDKTHCALDSGCPSKLAAEARAKVVYNQRPTRFRTGSATDRPAGSSSPAPTLWRSTESAHLETPLSVPVGDPLEEEGYGNARAETGQKRRRGRPAGAALAAAARNTMPISQFIKPLRRDEAMEGIECSQDDETINPSASL